MNLNFIESLITLKVVMYSVILLPLVVWWFIFCYREKISGNKTDEDMFQSQKLAKRNYDTNKHNFKAFVLLLMILSQLELWSNQGTIKFNVNQVIQHIHNSIIITILELAYMLGAIFVSYCVFKLLKWTLLKLDLYLFNINSTKKDILAILIFMDIVLLILYYHFLPQITI